MSYYSCWCEIPPSVTDDVITHFTQISSATTFLFAQDSSPQALLESLTVNRHLQRIETFCSADSCLAPPSASAAACPDPLPPSSPASKEHIS
ncbi:hypothetical protein Q8A67_022861 [Cirrhinus molitorella]|uniref:Uncharacterized protein n=1 Tax=Cirrhinus molitorella TaxID=172907 RepID=A0AA88P8W3_9TELE|nr:hypothetical protein Q8A67_022861 [Cirrhinus molitorella]